MRITIEVDDRHLRQIQKLTGQRKKSPAVAQALTEYLRQCERASFIERALSGQTNYALTNEELEARDLYETR